MPTHYTLCEDGYRIIGSNETFNRSLYGGHGNDANVEKYFTLAGDQPIVMGAVTDWRAQAACLHAKCGVLMMGVALTPGVSVPVFGYDGSGERTSQWFHESPGTDAVFRNGWMEYHVWPFFQCFPRVEADIEVLPVQDYDGFLVHLRITSEQRIHLVMGLGGITDYIGRFEAPYVKRRRFTKDDCVGNTVTVGTGTAEIRGSDQIPVDTSVRMSTTLPATLTVVEATDLESPGAFVGTTEKHAAAAPMLRMDCIVSQSEPLEGRVVVLRNASENEAAAVVEDPQGLHRIKQQIRAKRSAIRIRTPDAMLDATVPAGIIAMDACWQDNTFHHGAFAWHCPYMGWRNWYGPTTLGWHGRVQTAFKTHAATQKPKGSGAERVEYTGPGQYAKLVNSHGFLPEIPDGRDRIFYTMQEVGVDMALHSIEWTGDMSYAADVFDTIARVLDWEERILDPDGDGLYQNWLNTWISDAHSYNGGGCAQSSAYNYSANLRMAKIADRIGRNPAVFEHRARKIRDAVNRTLWMPEKGVVAEYIDTIGNRLIHPSPELATIYHCIEADIVDQFQAYQMLRFTETDIRNERTINREGRLVWSSNWYPQNYSSCGLYPAENIHLAWAYYRCGLSEHAADLMDAIVDSHYLSRFPGVVAHCLSPQGYSSGSSDFTEIPSMMLRTVVEGLFGIRVKLLDNELTVAPNFPHEWESAHLENSDVSVDYTRRGNHETLRVASTIDAQRSIRMPMRRTGVAEVTLNGQPNRFTVEPGIGRSDIVVTSDGPGESIVQITHEGDDRPAGTFPSSVPHGARIEGSVPRGAEIAEIRDHSSCLTGTIINGRRFETSATGAPGHHTVFIRTIHGDWDGWLPADIEIRENAGGRGPAAPAAEHGSPRFAPVPINQLFNCELTRIHDQEYWSPRPKSYSIMTRLNGRFGWDWNHCGHNEVRVDDGVLRNAGGTFTTTSGTPILTPQNGPNVACVSVWDNFPDTVSIPLSGTGDEVAVMFVGVTNPMQSRVQNGLLEVRYTDGTSVSESLVNPESFDDWLNAALQRRHETEYFNEYNHAIVARLQSDPEKRLSELVVTAVANEVIVGVIGVTIVSY